MLAIAGIHMIVALSLQTSIEAGIKLPGRREAVIDETYFGSEQLLNTEIVDVKPFIAEFTLPADSLEVAGSPEQLYQQMKSYGKLNTTHYKLIMNLVVNDTNAQYFSLLLDFPSYSKTELVNELWILLHYDNVPVDDFYGMIMLNIDTTKFERLKKLYIISMSTAVTSPVVLVPHGFEDVMVRLETLVLRGIAITACRTLQVSMKKCIEEDLKG